MCQLAQLYHQGIRGIEQNDKKAVKIWKRAAELGNVSAMNGLAFNYFHGKGVKPDKKKAMQLYERASKTGNPRATCNLGLVLCEHRRFEEAVQLFRLSAEQNFTDSLCMLGNCYLHGEGVEADLDEAKRWYARAAANGDERAIELLRSNALPNTL